MIHYCVCMYHSDTLLCEFRNDALYVYHNDNYYVCVYHIDTLLRVCSVMIHCVRVCVPS